MHTYRSALALAGVTVPAHLVADAEVPMLDGPQAQGDLLILPRLLSGDVGWEPVPDQGVQMVHGEATGNTHWLHRGFDSPDVLWTRSEEETLVGYLRVPHGQSALLLHTDEHGANAIGPGDYAVLRKREQRDLGIRIVQD